MRNKVTPVDVVTEARTYINTPYQHQGRTKGLGIDCAGLLECLARGFNLTDFTLSNYDRLPDGVELMRICDAHMDRVGIQDMQIGDVAVMKFERHPQHIGILADYIYGGFSLIHAHSISGKVVEHRLDSKWHARIVAVFRLRYL